MNEEMMDGMLKSMFQSVMLERFVKDVWDSATPEVKRTFADAVVKSTTHDMVHWALDSVTKSVLKAFIESAEGKAWMENAQSEFAKMATALTNSIVKAGVDSLSRDLAAPIEKAIKGVEENISHDIRQRIDVAISVARGGPRPWGT